jgi:hypothetical protein
MQRIVKTCILVIIFPPIQILYKVTPIRRVVVMISSTLGILPYVKSFYHRIYRAYYHYLVAPRERLLGFADLSPWGKTIYHRLHFAVQQQIQRKT